MTDYSFHASKKKSLIASLILATKNEHFGAGLRVLALGMLIAAKLQNSVPGVF